MLGHKNLRLIPRRSIKSGSVPSKLDHFEISINLADGLVWIGNNQGKPILIKELTNSPEIFSGDFRTTIIPKSVS